MYEDIILYRYVIRCRWLEFASLQGIFNRRRELMRLSQWASKKRLTGPRRLYQRRLEQEEIRLARVVVRSPGITRIAWIINLVGHLLCSEPRYHRGVAARYRYCNLTEI